MKTYKGAFSLPSSLSVIGLKAKTYKGAECFQSYNNSLLDISLR